MQSQFNQSCEFELVVRILQQFLAAGRLNSILQGWKGLKSLQGLPKLSTRPGLTNISPQLNRSQQAGKMRCHQSSEILQSIPQLNQRMAKRLSAGVKQVPEHPQIQSEESDSQAGDDDFEDKVLSRLEELQLNISEIRSRASSNSRKSFTGSRISSIASSPRQAINYDGTGQLTFRSSTVKAHARRRFSGNQDLSQWRAKFNQIKSGLYNSSLSQIYQGQEPLFEEESEIQNDQKKTRKPILAQLKINFPLDSEKDGQCSPKFLSYCQTFQSSGNSGYYRDKFGDFNEEPESRASDKNSRTRQLAFPKKILNDPSKNKAQSSRQMKKIYSFQCLGKLAGRDRNEPTMGPA